MPGPSGGQTKTHTVLSLTIMTASYPEPDIHQTVGAGLIFFQHIHILRPHPRHMCIPIYMHTLCNMAPHITTCVHAGALIQLHTYRYTITTEYSKPEITAPAISKLDNDPGYRFNLSPYPSCQGLCAPLQFNFK